MPPSAAFGASTARMICALREMVDVLKSHQVSRSPIDRMPSPDTDADSVVTARSVHAGASGSSQSGTGVSFISLLKLMPLLFRPHGAVNTSGVFAIAQLDHQLRCA